MMKAAVVEKPGVLTVRAVPEPKIGDYEALCELLYGAVCTGTDTHIVDGVFPFSAPLPTILGHESIGRVLKVGPKVRTFRPGDLVTRVGTPAVGDCSVTWGGFAEFGVAHDHQAMRQDGLEAARWSGWRVNQLLPAGFDPAASTMIITWRETLSYLTRMGVGNGASLLVIGSGGNGLAFVAHAVNRGAAGVAMVGAAARAGAARRLGAADYADYRAADWADRLAERHPAGFDFVIDALGRVGILDAALRFLKPGGTLGQYGIDDFGRCTLSPLASRGTFRFYNGGYDEPETHTAVVEAVRGGKLPADVWLELAHPWPLDRIGDALAALRSRRGVKALIRIRGGN
jgi:threonine dehydrogenase-like Zn-dependent dehydrogenase